MMESIVGGRLVFRLYLYRSQRGLGTGRSYLDHARHLHRDSGNLRECAFADDAIAEFQAVEGNHHRPDRGFDEADIIDYTPI